MTRVVTNETGTEDYWSIWLAYARNKRAMTYAVGETWQGSDPTDTRQVQWGREFRYDGARRRYLNAVLDPDDLEQQPPAVTRASSTWSDYDGDEVLGDFTVTGSPPTVTNVQSFEPGVGKFSWSGGAPDPTSRQYYHTDMIGTTRFMSNSAGSQVDPAVYTAFGERVCSLPGGNCQGVPNHRYGYAGPHGYQAHDEFPFLHVGARGYARATGRFLQRDPMGIGGGFNVYEYVGSDPTGNVDPAGLVPNSDPLWGRPLWPMDQVHPGGGRLGRRSELARLRDCYRTDAAARLRRLELYGGRHSWLDDPKTVKKVQLPIKIVGTCATWLAPPCKGCKVVAPTNLHSRMGTGGN